MEVFGGTRFWQSARFGGSTLVTDASAFTSSTSNPPSTVPYTPRCHQTRNTDPPPLSPRLALTHLLCFRPLKHAPHPRLEFLVCTCTCHVTCSMNNTSTVTLLTFVVDFQSNAMVSLVLSKGVKNWECQRNVILISILERRCRLSMQGMYSLLWTVA